VVLFRRLKALNCLQYRSFLLTTEDSNTAQPLTTWPPLPPAERRELKSFLLYEGEGLVVVSKPPGISCSGLAMTDPNCLQYRLMQYYGARVWTVHQLDADTSGVNLYALRRAVAADAQQRMHGGGAVKKYLALCHGAPEFETVEVDAPIGFVDEQQRCLGVTPRGRAARSQVTVLARHGQFAALDIRIFTGRTHQIRIHLSHLGHPLVGEHWYIDKPCDLSPRQALHAAGLRFTDGREPRQFDAPWPADLAEVAQRLGLPFDLPNPT
jgi:23S rRNA pseudouridine1911/1915/1917 synthase